MSSTPEQRHYLHALGIEVWLERGQGTEDMGLEQKTEDRGRGAEEGGQGQGAEVGISVASSVDQEVGAEPGREGWEALKNEVANCRLCELHRGRTQTVFGVGDVNADWMLIGEAPGAEEDRRGEPFVGRAGKLLDSMLQAVGLTREKVFIANILKCRPPNNRDPKPEEVSSCENYLAQQINTVKPKLILALGRVAAQNLLKTETPIGKMRGNRYQYGEPPVPVVVTYHPAYLLRAPREKKKSWQDLQLAMTVYKEQS